MSPSTFSTSTTRSIPLETVCDWNLFSMIADKANESVETELEYRNHRFLDRICQTETLGAPGLPIKSRASCQWSKKTRTALISSCLWVQEQRFTHASADSHLLPLFSWERGHGLLYSYDLTHCNLFQTTSSVLLELIWMKRLVNLKRHILCTEDYSYICNSVQNDC